MTLIDDLQRQIDQRLGELLPLVEEYAALRQLRTTIETLDPAAAAAELAAFATGAGDDGARGSAGPAASREPATDAPAESDAEGPAPSSAGDPAEDGDEPASADGAAGSHSRGTGRRSRRRSTAPAAPRKARRSAGDGARTRPAPGADELAAPEHLDEEQADAAFHAIAATPGMTAAQLAAALEVPVSDLFRLLPQLQRDGRIRKQGKGYLPAEARA